VSDLKDKYKRGIGEGEIGAGGFERICFSLIKKQNIQISQCHRSFIIELFEKREHFPRFFPKEGIFVDFLFSSSEAAIAGGACSAPFCVFKSS
jgi:hypothetical protein